MKQYSQHLFQFVLTAALSPSSRAATHRGVSRVSRDAEAIYIYIYVLCMCIYIYIYIYIYVCMYIYIYIYIYRV